MTRRAKDLVIYAGLVGLLTMTGVAQDAPAVVPVRDQVDRLEARLTALDPTAPHLYLELGEEVSAQASDDEALGLARRLFVLALTGGLDASDRAIAGGACLALAQIAETDRERRWFEALARNSDERIGGRHQDEMSVTTQAGIDASAALARIRAGNGRVARRVLENAEVRAAIAVHAPDAWIDRLESEARNWPCPECRNDRFVQDKDRPGDRRLCSTCAGNPGPAYARGELIEHLRIEAALIGVSVDSWSAQLAVGRTEPLREADPREVAAYYAIDPARACWRDGRWVMCAAEVSAP